ncbi:uncharacterized protein L3040_000379 [Drepanopeziza brunnea f. sp. 'multigermtubi']|uniref:uncharacterized protein n=1 Tax=Drepanopeziza brunnea f. sp. 'multigermtubi' TaxID=698441 RepID=UPI00238CB84D|nr:hypothetical protein L3040_000379 [Drepanopeziza brunnea f. sp. 'multigermtubi']
METQSPGPEINDFGFTTYYFVHGLQGHPRKTRTFEKSPKRERTFKRPRETSSSSHLGIRNFISRRSSSQDGRDAKPAEGFWPLDLLPDDCPNARILTWGYDSRVTNFFGSSANQSNVSAHARNLVHALRRPRLECPGRPIIFVAHSLGGVVMKCAICRAANDDTL